MNSLQNHVEVLIFCSPKSIKISEIRDCLTEMLGTETPETDILQTIEQINQKYSSDSFSFGLKQVAGGYQFLTKPTHQAIIKVLLKQQSKKRLSHSALETLSIVAYKQPISKLGIEQIRGVNCSYTIQKLLEKGLIQIKGKSNTPGRSLLYVTSDKFMEYFGINSLKDMPIPKDFTTDENEIGTEHA